MGAGTSINSQMASHKLAVNGISLRFSLPSNMKVVEGSLDPEDPSILTTGESGVTLTLTQTELRISISPPLLIDPFMVSTHALSGLTYTFLSQRADYTLNVPSGGAILIPGLSGSVTDIRLTDVGASPFAYTESIRSGIKEAFMNMIRSTRYTKPNYVPLNDPDPAGGLAEIKANLSAAPNTGKVNVGVAFVDRVGGEIDVTTTDPIVYKTSGNGVEIPAGTRIKISIHLLGNVTEITNKFLGLSELSLNADQMFLLLGGERAVKVTSLVMSYGGKVRIVQYEMLNKAVVGAGVLEALLRYAAAAERKDSQPLEGRMTVSSMAEAQVNEALTNAVRQLYVGNFESLRKAVDPFSLEPFFGLKRNGEPWNSAK